MVEHGARDGGVGRRLCYQHQGRRALPAVVGGAGVAPKAEDDAEGGDGNRTRTWPSLAPGKRATLAFFPGQARSVRLAPRSQAPAHVQGPV